MAVGNSPNPGGQLSVLVKAGKRAKNTALEHAEEAVWTLVGLMREARSEKIRHDAAVSLLDRAIGRPSPSTGEDEDELESLRRVTDEAVDAVLDSE